MKVVMELDDLYVSAENGVYFTAHTIQDSKRVVEEIRSTDCSKLVTDMRQWCKTGPDILLAMLRVVAGWTVLYKAKCHDLLEPKTLDTAKKLLTDYITDVFLFVYNESLSNPHLGANVEMWRKVGIDIRKLNAISEEVLSSSAVDIIRGSSHIIGADNHYFITSYLTCYPEQRFEILRDVFE